MKPGKQAMYSLTRCKEKDLKKQKGKSLENVQELARSIAATQQHSCTELRAPQPHCLAYCGGKQSPVLAMIEGRGYDMVWADDPGAGNVTQPEGTLKCSQYS